MFNRKINTLIDCSINIGDHGEYYDLREIIDILKYKYNTMSLHSMNDGAIFLQGEHSMLGDVIEYLNKIIGES